MKNDILKFLKNYDTLPFLFVGSGLSRRYLEMEGWEGLLRKFARMVKNNEYAFEIYLQEANALECKEGIFPKVAELIERDFNKLWFEDDRFKDSRLRYTDEITVHTSPFKIEIAKYMKEKSNNVAKDYQSELKVLQKIGKKSIAGVITTNYDSLLEKLFDNYVSYIGQEELIFSSIQGIAEIYKIHGCCTKPNSIVINEKDYVDFAQRNAYLAAKILTIFLEHPIIFIGYSISDKNVEDILKAIVRCLSMDNLMKLKERLIFVEWNDGDAEDEISTYSKQFEGGKSIDMTRIKLKNYETLYGALLENKSKYYAPMLRKLKEDIYDLVRTNKPSGKIRTVGLEDDDRLEDVEVVIGVGILGDFGKKGYAQYTAEEVYRDVVFDDMKLESEYVVKYTLPNLLKHHNGSIPIYKYVSSFQGEIPEKVKQEIKENFEDLLSRTIKNNKDYHKIKMQSIGEIRNKYPDLKTLQYLTLLKPEDIDVGELNDLLRDVMMNEVEIMTIGKSTDKVNLRRAIKIYDWLRYKQKKRSD